MDSSRSRRGARNPGAFTLGSLWLVLPLSAAACSSDPEMMPQDVGAPPGAGVQSGGGVGTATGGTAAPATGGTTASATGGTAAPTTGGVGAATGGMSGATGGMSGATGGMGGATGGMGGATGGMGGATGGMGAMADAGVTTDGGSDSGPGTGEYSPCPTDGSACKILPFGDSITYGIDIATGSTGGYRVELFRKALEAGQNITFVGDGMASGPSQVDGEPFPRDNEGHSGWTVSQIHRRVPSPALDDDPHIILLMIGTNDMTFGNRGATDDLAALLDDLIENAPDALIVLAQIVPRGSGNSATEDYNATMPGLVDERTAAGAHIMLVDMYTGYETSWLGDGVHPNETGYAYMADVWYEAIGDLLP